MGEEATTTMAHGVDGATLSGAAGEEMVRRVYEKGFDTTKDMKKPNSGNQLTIQLRT